MVQCGAYKTVLGGQRDGGAGACSRDEGQRVADCVEMRNDLAAACSFVGGDVASGSGEQQVGLQHRVGLFASEQQKVPPASSRGPTSALGLPSTSGVHQSASPQGSVS